MRVSEREQMKASVREQIKGIDSTKAQRTDNSLSFSSLTLTLFSHSHSLSLSFSHSHSLFERDRERERGKLKRKEIEKEKEKERKRENEEERDRERGNLVTSKSRGACKCSVPCMYQHKCRVPCMYQHTEYTSTRRLPLELPGRTSENGYLLCVCTRRAYGPL